MCDIFFHFNSSWRSKLVANASCIFNRSATLSSNRRCNRRWQKKTLRAAIWKAPGRRWVTCFEQNDWLLWTMSCQFIPSTWVGSIPTKERNIISGFHCAMSPRMSPHNVARVATCLLLWIPSRLQTGLVNFMKHFRALLLAVFSSPGGDVSNCSW